MSEQDTTDGPGGPREGDETESTSAGATRSPADAPSTTDIAQAVEPPPDTSAAEAFHQRARLAEDRLAEVLDAYRSLRQETEAYRERFTRNIERRFDQRRERLLLKFIEILDNLDRALEAAEATGADQSLIEGIILVRTQLLQTLQEEGLERIPVLGLPYDPHLSEAVATEPVADADHHHLVVKEMQRGYRLNGRIARASRVIVGEYPAAGRAEPPPEPAPAAAPTEESPQATPREEEGPSLDDIVKRAEAQEALFPDAFEDHPYRPRRDGEGED